MKLNSLIAARPVFFFFFLAFVVLLLPALVIPYWHRTTRHIERDMILKTKLFHSQLQFNIQSVGKLLSPLNSSVPNIAKLLSLYVNGSELSFNEIETKVAPLLFQSFLTIPFMSQISYVGLNGILFSYYIDGDQVLAVYSNSSFSSNSSQVMEDVWYKQEVDRVTGKLYGEAIKSKSSNVVKTSWFQASLNSTDGYASLGDGWGGGRDPLILNSAGIHGRAVVSLGFPVKALTDFLAVMDLYGGRLFLSTKDGEMLMEGIPNAHMILANDGLISFQVEKPNDQAIAHPGHFHCTPENSSEFNGILTIGETKFNVLCSPIEILGVQLVYALLMPHRGLARLVQQNNRLALIFLVTIIAAVIVSVFSFVLLIVRAARREMHLCATLIKQMEATQQAERKSMNKSLAFSSASHDIRTSLACITELIRTSRKEVVRGSELESNLKDMDSSTKNLLGLLNSILDMSKIEAGKMQLEEEEFSLVEMLERVADSFHLMGMKKGVDVVLDPFDGSILKFSHVRGDGAKLERILCNLLSNAVKFTSEGHVSLRAWVQKPSLQTSILASNQSGLNKSLSRFFYKNKETCDDIKAIDAVRHNPNSMEFVFEVEDTGRGIPKEKQNSVFESFVQVKDTATRREQKETALGNDQEETALSGTGLGLPIVQSLVRLMGGEIGIVDKEIGEKGTCFRFNVFLETASAGNVKGENEAGENPTAANGVQHSGLTIQIPNPSLNSRTPSPRLGILSSSPRLDGSQVVLLIQNNGRRGSLQKYMESLGINVSAVGRWEKFFSVLEKIKSKQNCSSCNSIGKLGLCSRSNSTNSKDLPLSTMDGTEQKHQSCRKKGPSGFILLVIDAGAGPFEKLHEIVSEFRRDLQSTCKVVWLDNSISRTINSREEIYEKEDDLLVKPLHGSRLYQVINLLPEFGGNLKRKNTFQAEKVSQDCSSSSAKPFHVKPKLENPLLHEQPLQQGEIQEDGNPRARSGRLRTSQSHDQYQPRQTEMQEIHVDSREKKLWSGKRILVAEDVLILRKVTAKKLEQDGAIVEVCKNGDEAVNLVRNGLRDQREKGASHVLPYDYILMDCEMPVMDGFEATRRIREEEKVYGVHLPIFALTSHTVGEETNRAIRAGMDCCLQGKPLEDKALIEAITKIHGGVEID